MIITSDKYTQRWAEPLEHISDSDTTRTLVDTAGECEVKWSRVRIRNTQIQIVSAKTKRRWRKKIEHFNNNKELSWRDYRYKLELSDCAMRLVLVFAQSQNTHRIGYFWRMHFSLPAHRTEPMRLVYEIRRWFSFHCVTLYPYKIQYRPVQPSRSREGKKRIYSHSNPSIELNMEK